LNYKNYPQDDGVWNEQKQAIVDKQPDYTDNQPYYDESYDKPLPGFNFSKRDIDRSNRYSEKYGRDVEPTSKDRYGKGTYGGYWGNWKPRK